MIASLSKKIAEQLYFSNRNAQNNASVEVYAFGLELIISTIVTFTCIVGISLILDLFVEALLFMLFFAVFRRYAGGFHASTHLMCFLIFALLCFATIYAVVFISNSVTNALFALIGMGCVTIILVYLFAPVSSENKPLSKRQIIKYKKISRLFIIALLAIIGLLFVVIFNRIDYAFVSTGALLIETLTLVPCFNKGGKEIGKIDGSN